MANENTIPLHDYKNLPGLSELYGIPVHTSLQAVTRSTVAYVKPWKERWWKPWDSIGYREIETPTCYMTNLPEFGKRLIVHPSLMDLIKGEIDRDQTRWNF